ncbi:hypothetical protein Lal_00038024 [Lupinus albus]|nr:hypothetical protein Lal_00038024 [Lupinus albus]
MIIPLQWLKSTHTGGFSPKRDTIDHKPQLLKNSRPCENLSPKRETSDHKPQLLKNSRPCENLSPKQETSDHKPQLLKNSRPARISRPSEGLSPKNQDKSDLLLENDIPFSPRRGETSFKATILADFRPGENPSLKRGYQVKILWVCRSGEIFLLKRGFLVQIHKLFKVSSTHSSSHTHSSIMRTKSTANKNHPPHKKHKSGTSGQATPSYNRNKFTSLEREERYNTLLQWTFVPERRVELQRNEYPNFLTKLDELKWGTLASPHNKFEPDVVQEFYANAYPPEEGGGLFEHKSWMLNNPYEVSEDSLDGYHQLVAQNSTMAHGFRIAETVETLCLPGRSASANLDGRPKRIYGKDMTTLAQIWMIFCLHNIIPNSHVSSLPLFDCHLL